jgi:hypothetical protein
MYDGLEEENLNELDQDHADPDMGVDDQTNFFDAEIADALPITPRKDILAKDRLESPGLYYNSEPESPFARRAPRVLEFETDEQHNRQPPELHHAPSDTNARGRDEFDDFSDDMNAEDLLLLVEQEEAARRKSLSNIRQVDGADDSPSRRDHHKRKRQTWNTEDFEDMLGTIRSDDIEDSDEERKRAAKRRSLKVFCLT